MKRNHAAQGLIVLAILMLVGTTAAACTSDDAPSANPPSVETTDQTSGVDASSVEPVQETRAAVGVHPADLRTGISGLDPVLEAVASDDPAAIAARLQLLDTPCTTAEGLGGPPKCDEGMAVGTIVSVFPILGSEGYFVTAEDLAALAESLEIAGLFGVYQVTAEPNPEEAYWPSGDFGVVLVGAGPATRVYTLLVEDGNIVRLVDHPGSTPEQAFDAGRGVIIVPPLQ